MAKKQKELTFEERMQRLQVIVSTLENGDKPLEESVELYKEGLEHSLACRDMLGKARHEIEILTEGALSPFMEEKDENSDTYDDGDED